MEVQAYNLSVPKLSTQLLLGTHTNSHAHFFFLSSKTLHTLREAAEIHFLSSVQIWTCAYTPSVYFEHTLGVLGYNKSQFCTYVGSVRVSAIAERNKGRAQMLGSFEKMKGKTGTEKYFIVKL